MSDSPEAVELNFILELARIGLYEKGTIYAVGIYLEEDRTEIDILIKANPRNPSLAGKIFLLRWHDKNKGNDDRFRNLKIAFDRAKLSGQFEQAEKKTKFRLPTFCSGQLELAGDRNVDDKLITFIEELPLLISSPNLLMDFGLRCGCTLKEIQSVTEDHINAINDAGRELIQKIIREKTGLLSTKVLTLQNAYEQAEGPREFKRLLAENGISEADLRSEQPVQATLDEVSHAFQEFDLVHDRTDQVTDLIYDQRAGAANNDTPNLRLAREVASEGVFDENQAMFAAEQLQEPTVTRVKELLRVTFRGQTEPVRSTSLTAAAQINLGDSGFHSVSRVCTGNSSFPNYR